MSMRIKAHGAEALQRRTYVSQADEEHVDLVRHDGRTEIVNSTTARIVNVTNVDLEFAP